jgi:hypothetical protein
VLSSLSLQPLKLKLKLKREGGDCCWQARSLAKTRPAGQTPLTIFKEKREGEEREGRERERRKRKRFGKMTIENECKISNAVEAA